MSTANVAVQLFQQIKSSLPASAALVDEIAAALNISSDSAYRRIRGEKSLSLEELHALCQRYSVSLDALMGLKTGTVCFESRILDPASFRFEDYLASVIRQMQYMASFRERSMVYLCKDIPLFHHYHFKELAAFKYFFWHKTFLESPAFSTRKVVLREYPEEVYALGKKRWTCTTPLTPARFGTPKA